MLRLGVDAVKSRAGKKGGKARFELLRRAGPDAIRRFAAAGGVARWRKMSSKDRAAWLKLIGDARRQAWLDSGAPAGQPQEPETSEQAE